jgi:predicted RNase H-like nuclease
LKAQTCDEADTMNRATDPHAPGISRQACAIIPKIREVDGFITRSLQRRVVEVHPELSFYEMNRRTPIVESKKSTAGRARRIQLLTRRWERKLSDFVDSRLRGVGPDDILDAMAVCWTAERVLKAKAVTVPRHPPHDSRGLRMEIVR